MRTYLIFLVMFCTTLGTKAVAGPAEDQADKVFKASAVRGGLIVHVGCGQGHLTAALRATDSYVVHGLDTAAENVEAARAHIASLELYGKVSADTYNGESLPYVDNLVNLLVIEPTEKLSQAELLRVLAPNGVACIQQDDEWRTIRKPRPANIDEWSHFMHGPNNNPVSQDECVDYPSSLQWLASPLWTRDHDATPCMFGLVFAGGRLFYIHDRGPIGMFDRRLPGRHVLMARDAFNGTLLWEVPLPSWYDSNVIWGTVPTHLHRRLIATPEHVYVTKGISGPVAMLDAATGAEVRMLENSAGTGEMLLDENLLVIGKLQAAPRPEDGLPMKREEPLRPTGLREHYRRGQSISVHNLETGKTEWSRSCKFVPLTLCVDEGRLLVGTDEQVLCLDLASGTLLWTHAAKAAFVMACDNTVIVTERGKPQRAVPIQVHALLADDGRMLWSVDGNSLPTFGNFFFIVPQVFVSQGTVWLESQQGQELLGLELRTGKPAKQMPIGTALTPGHHVRCYPAKATKRFILTNKRGIEFLDVSGETPPRKHDWVRATCRLGIVPCNGMIYAPPHGCNCSVETTLRGLCALGSQMPPPADPANRVERGPAVDSQNSRSGSASASENSTGDWPTYRKDGVRSCATSLPLTAGLKMSWEISFDAKMSSPVLADGKIFLSQIDAHQVYAVDAAGGRKLWDFRCGGRVDGPPTVAAGRVVFGSADGWVYCLRAADGVLVWRFRAAPSERRMVAFGQVESCWPVHASALVDQNVVYVSAGRSSYLDGGIHLYSLDLLSGRMIHTTQVTTPQQIQNTTMQHTFNVPGTLSDVLVGDGQYVFMRHARLDQELNQATDLFPLSDQTKGAGRRAMATSGFLDHTGYSRVYRACNDTWSGRYSSRRTQQLAFDETTVYGCRMYYDRGWKSPRFHAGEGSLLFAQDHANTSPDKLMDITQYSLHENIKWSFPIPQHTYRWHRRVPMWIQAMALTPDKLIVAGRPDTIPDDDPYAALDGRLGGQLLVVSTATGETSETIDLPAPPVVDGVIVAGDVYVTTQDGRLLCLSPAR